MKKVLLSLLTIGLTLMYSTTFAQDTTHVNGKCAHHMMGPGPQVMTAEQIAKSETDRMQQTLQLTDKQYKKVYKVNLTEAEVLAGSNNKKSSDNQNGGNFQGGPMGGGPGGMGPGMGHGQHPDMQQGGMNQKDTTGFKKGHRMMPGFAPKCTPEEAKAAKEKKMARLKEILSDYQYNMYDKEQTEKEMNENCPFCKDKKSSQDSNNTQSNTQSTNN